MLAISSGLGDLGGVMSKRAKRGKTETLALPVAGKVAVVAIACQSALEWDPLTAFKRDPFDRRVLLVALASSELVGVAETARARVVWSSSRLLKRQLSLPVSTMSQ